MLKPETVARTKEKLLKKYPGEAGRIGTGVDQAAAMWTKKDGGPKVFKDFCFANFMMTGPDLEALLARFEDKLEAFSGAFNGLSLNLRREMDEDTGAPHPADRLFAALSPSAHLTEDLFASKLAFMVLLNFPVRRLAECLEKGESWDRDEWARTRLARRFAFRVPPEINQRIAAAYSAADAYIYSYNIHMNAVVDPDGRPMFPKGLRLISHWGLRDQLKGLYAGGEGALGRQRVIQRIMERIISQEIPAKAVNSDRRPWEPFANVLDGKPAPGEGGARYARMLEIFRAHRGEDAFYPSEPTLMDRRFHLDREIPEAEVEKMFTGLLTAPEGAAAGALIKTRLGRDLEAFDIWYDGFKPRSSMAQEELDKAAARLYPDAAAFEKDIPAILRKLGFDGETADFIGSRIEVDPARGAGHAWGPGMRGQKAHLRTRVPAGGMNYLGFNIAMHELGHCVEQVISLYKVDHTLLSGVPNTAFTEGFAFVFQSRDLEMLGMENKDPLAAHLSALDNFWATREIAGVALVDMNAWRWMYKNADAEPGELREAVTEIAKGVWDRYFAPVLGTTGSPLLAIYSHMINAGLYLPDYPLGHIIAFQVEEHLRKHGLAAEMERMCRLGSITPGEWMRQAVGGPISPEPMIKAAAAAIAALEKKK